MDDHIQKAYNTFLSHHTNEDDLWEWGEDISNLQQLATHDSGDVLYGFSVQKTLHTEAPDEFESKGRELTLNAILVCTRSKDISSFLVGMTSESRIQLLDRSLSVQGWNVNFELTHIDLSRDETLGSYADSTGDLRRLY
jgi:hypothetical protein